MASNYNAYVGLDVHEETISAAIADAGQAGEVRLIGVIKNEPEAIAKLQFVDCMGKRILREVAIRGSDDRRF